MSMSYKTSLEVLCERKEIAFLKKYIDRLDISGKSYAAALENAADRQDQEVIRFLLSKGETILIK